MIGSIIKLFRPKQWAKNLFVFLPLFFSGKLLDSQLLYFNFITFTSFCLIASSIYCFNDIYDVEADKKHPKKCKRPIASGAISTFQAYGIMATLLIVSLTIQYVFGNENKNTVLSILLLYFFMNIAYCIILKHYVIIDVAIIAIGFVLRVIVGGKSTGVELSEWIIILTFILALFLGFAKRRDDVVLYEKTGLQTRPKTPRYTLDFMNQVLTVLSSITLVAYLMYTISPEAIQNFKSKHVYFTSVFVLLAIIRYLQKTIVDASSGSPTEILYTERFIQLCILGWITSFFIIIYV